MMFVVLFHLKVLFIRDVSHVSIIVVKYDVVVLFHLKVLFICDVSHVSIIVVKYDVCCVFACCLLLNKNNSFIVF